MTTPEPVSPAPDTEALRQQVAAVLEERIGDNSDLYETVDDVLPLFAEREAGLRADLDQARAELADYAEQYAGQREELTRLRQERAAIELQHGREVDALHVEIKRLRAELAGAHPIPDDAAAQIAQCLSDYWISLRGRRQDADETEHGQAEDVDRLVRSWLAPTTGPAPAAADGLREEYAGFFHPAWPDPLHFQYGDDPRANAARWYAEHVEQQPQIEVRRRVLSDWVTVDVTAPAAPQAPAEPTGQFYEDDEPAAKVRAAFEQGPHLITAPPNTAAAPARVAPAAREDTAPPDVIRDVLAARDAVLDAPPNWLADNPGLIPPDDYGDNLTAGFLRAPVGACSCQPTAAVIHVPGTYCGDTQYEQAVDAMRATTGRPGDERDEEAVSAVLGYLANPTPEEKQ